jgi:hypothetical protein
VSPASSIVHVNLKITLARNMKLPFPTFPFAFVYGTLKYLLLDPTILNQTHPHFSQEFHVSTGCLRGITFLNPLQLPHPTLP